MTEVSSPIKQETFNQIQGQFDLRSPIYKPLHFTQSVKDSVQFKLKENPEIQYHDLRYIPPKHYKVDHFSTFKQRQFPQYPSNKVVHEDYQRIMKEYQVIEDQEDEKRAKFKINGVKKVSPHKRREVESAKPDSLKLSPDEIPYNLLQKIDKMVQQKLKEITPEVLQTFAQKNYQSTIEVHNMTPIKKQSEKKQVSNGTETEMKQYETVLEGQDQELKKQLDEFEQWCLKKQIEEKLRKTFIKETLRNLEFHKQKQLEETSEERKLKKEKLAEWHQQKEFNILMKKGWDKRVKEMNELDKMEKQAKGKQAFMDWLQGHCERLKQQKMQQLQDEYQKQIKQQKQLIAQSKRREMAKAAFQQWVQRKRSESKQIKRQSSYDVRGRQGQFNTIQVQRPPSYSRQQLVNIMIKPDRLQNQQRVNNFMIGSNDQGDHILMGSPTKQAYKYDDFKSPKGRKSSGNKKKKVKAKKKFSVNRNHMKQQSHQYGAQSQNQQKGYIDRISEEKSSEASYKQKKEDYDISSIVRHNQSQPAENTVESMISGMEAGGDRVC